MTRAPRRRRPAGRRPDPDADRRIIEATMRLLSEQGFARMSMEGVAAAAGVAKTTLYRRWSDKTELAGAAIAASLDEVDPGDLGSAYEELIRHLRYNRERIDPAIPGGLLAEEDANPALLEAFRERVIRPRFSMITGTLQRGVDRGELRRDLDVEAAAEMLAGAFFARYLHRGQPDADWPRRVVDAAWPGLAAPSRARPRQRAR